MKRNPYPNGSAPYHLWRAARISFWAALFFTVLAFVMGIALVATVIAAAT